MKRLNITNLNEMGVIFNACEVYDNKNEYVLLFKNRSKFERAWSLNGSEVKIIEFHIDKNIDGDMILVKHKYFSSTLEMLQTDDRWVTASNFKTDIASLIFKRIKKH